MYKKKKQTVFHLPILFTLKKGGSGYKCVFFFWGGGRISNEVKHVQAHNNSITHTHTHLYQIRRLMPSIIKCFSVFPFYYIVKFSFFVSELEWCNTWWENVFYHTQWIKENGWERAFMIRYNIASYLLYQTGGKKSYFRIVKSFFLFVVVKIKTGRKNQVSYNILFRWEEEISKKYNERIGM
jgi:hypothetical protein